MGERKLQRRNKRKRTYKGTWQWPVWEKMRPIFMTRGKKEKEKGRKQQSVCSRRCLVAHKQLGGLWASQKNSMCRNSKKNTRRTSKECAQNAQRIRAGHLKNTYAPNIQRKLRGGRNSSKSFLPQQLYRISFSPIRPWNFVLVFNPIQEELEGWIIQ